MTDGFDTETTRMMRAIEANWDARTPIHLASAFYGVDSRDPGFWFADFEWGDLGDVNGRDVLHLQCHLGTETVAFARRGARAVGLDLSGAAIAEARELARRQGLPIEYLHANVFDAVEAVQGRRFDVVYTGKGALLYLPDLERWARVVADLLRPGGQLYVVEFHPVLSALGLVPDPGEGETLTLRHDYLPGRGPAEVNSPYTYTDGPTLAEAHISYEWPHGLGELVNAVIGAGLRITALRESEVAPWPRWPRMLPTEHGWFRLPDNEPRVPVLYALQAVRPMI